MQHRALVVSLLSLAMVTVAVPVVVFAGTNIVAHIDAPANGAVLDRTMIVQFEGSATGNCPATSYVWTFGDGSGSVLQNPTHRYATLGPHSVRLTAAGVGCTDDDVQTVTVQNLLPSAQLSISPNPAAAGASVMLDAGSSSDGDGSVATYLFSIDGSPQPAQGSATLATSFTLAGTHQVSVQVRDNDGGLSGLLLLSLTVEPGPLASIAVSPSSVDVQAGATQLFTAAGADAYGNVVSIAPSWTADCGLFSAPGSWTAPDEAGTCTIHATQNGVDGSALAQVLPAPLDHITISGPAALEAGASASYDLAGFDQFGNPVALAQSTLDYTAATAAGPAQVCYDEAGVSACLDIEVLAGPLASIAVSGPDELAAGAVADFDLDGFDAYGNPVALASSSFSFTAPTAAGPAEACYAESGIEGCHALSVIAGPLAAITVSGSLTVEAGTLRTYNLAGADAYGNGVTLAQATLDWVAPTAAGPAQVCYSEASIDGCLDVDVIAGPVAEIDVSGPSEMPAGSTATFQLSARDQYGNPRDLAQSSLDFTAPTSVGDVQVCYDEDGASGCALVHVVHRDLAAILVSGPDSMEAGSSATFDLAGFDLYGNDVPLQQGSFDFTAPTSAGSAQACYSEGGVEGCRSLTIVAGPLASISVDGPGFVQAGDVATFSVYGVDEWANSVELAQPSFDWTAPTQAGPAEACYSESGIEGCMTVEVMSGPLALIAIDGPSQVGAGSVTSYALGGLDQYGNPVTLAQGTIELTAPIRAGEVTFCYTEDGVSACRTVEVLAGDLATILVTGPDEVEAGMQAVFEVQGFDAYDNSVALAQHTFVWDAAQDIGPARACYAEVRADGATVEGCQDVLVIAGPLASISVTGPEQLEAGTSATYALAGADQFGNPVALENTTIEYAGGTAAGPAQVCYSEQGVEGCMAIEIVPSSAVDLVIAGPDGMVVGSTAHFAYSATDAYGNPVDLAVDGEDITAPTAAGAFNVCYPEDDASGCRLVTALPDALASILVSGPESVVAGMTATFDVSGFDQYGNPVTLASASLDWTAPTLAGLQAVCYDEQGLQGCADVQVVHDALTSLEISGPATMQAGSSATFALAGFDQYRNDVPLAQAALDYAAPTLVGSYEACYSEQGIEACAPVLVVAGPLSQVLVSPGSVVANLNQSVQFSATGADAYGNPIAGLTFRWSASHGVIGSATGQWFATRTGAGAVVANASGVLGSAPVQVTDLLGVSVTMARSSFSALALGAVNGTVHVSYASGAPVRDAQVTVTFDNGATTFRVTGVTNNAGNLGFKAPTQATLPGSYDVVASALSAGNHGSGATSYSVAAI
ncbi:MAG TPA: PKD domain-containing protein [Candidatus Thermoplasmatota archaeon]|nr:PKD domain-containing protein [Candidatus Thermoplasmatota archaeon]